MVYIYSHTPSKFSRGGRPSRFKIHFDFGVFQVVDRTHLSLNPALTLSQYLAPIETVAFPPGWKLFSQSEIVHFVLSVGCGNISNQNSLVHALASCSRFCMHRDYAELGETDVYHFVNRSERSVYKSSSRGAPYPSGLPPLLGQRPSWHWRWCLRFP